MFSPVLGAAELHWAGHGMIVIDVPATWTWRSKPLGDFGYAVDARPAAGPAAEVQITIFATPPGQPVPASEIVERLRQSVRSVVENSVERAFKPVPLHVAQGTGWYAQFTDPSLVGKPPVPDNYKVMRNAMIGFDEHTLAVITMQFDDAKAPGTAEMLAMAESLRVQRTSVGPSLQIERIGPDFIVGLPGTKVALRIPAGQLERRNDHIGGATDSPRYFEFVNSKTGLVLSGWFETAGKYKGLHQLWNEESNARARHGQLEPQQVEFERSNGWDCVLYGLKLPLVNNDNIRAERVEGETWIDLHLSVTSRRSSREQRKELLAFLRTILAGRNP